jgi:hypothetical protein
MHCRQTRNSRPARFQTVNQDVYKVCYSVYRTVFDVVASSCGRQESGSSYTKMRHRIRHFRSKNARQYIKSLNCYMRHILQICHLAIFFLFPRLQRTLKGHRYEDIRVIQMAVTKQLCSILVLSTIVSKTPRNNGSGTFMQELFRRNP